MFPDVPREKLADINSQRMIFTVKGFSQMNACSQALHPFSVRCVDMRYDYSSDFLSRKLHLS